MMITQWICMLLILYQYLSKVPLILLVLILLIGNLGDIIVLVSVLKVILLQIVNVLLLVLKYPNNIGINGVIVHGECNTTTILWLVNGLLFAVKDVILVLILLLVTNVLKTGK